MPEFAVDPGHAGDEAVRLDGAADRARRRVDLVDLAVAVLAHPEAAFGPGEARVGAVAGCGNRGQHLASGGVDLVDARLDDLIEAGAVEGGAGVAGDVDAARGFAARGVEGDQLLAGGGPHLVAVVRHAVDALHAFERAVFAHDLRGLHRAFEPVLACLLALTATAHGGLL
ncbi:hypothetical protein D9M68_625850 [compost metagenome]